MYVYILVMFLAGQPVELVDYERRYFFDYELCVKEAERASWLLEAPVRCVPQL